MVACSAPAAPMGPITTTDRPSTATADAPVEAPKAAAYARGCDRGEPAQCHALAVSEFYSAERGGAEHDRRAVELFTKACDLGYAPSCKGLGDMYAQGRGVTKDAARAEALFARACRGGVDDACSAAGPSR